MADAPAGLAVSREFAAMGGTIQVQLVNRGGEQADSVEAMFASYESTMSRFLPDSELCALNAAAGSPFEASPVLFAAVRGAIAWARATHGIFDPTPLAAPGGAGSDPPGRPPSRSRP